MLPILMLITYILQKKACRYDIQLKVHRMWIRYYSDHSSGYNTSISGKLLRNLFDGYHQWHDIDRNLTSFRWLLRTHTLNMLCYIHDKILKFWVIWELQHSFDSNALFLYGTGLHNYCSSDLICFTTWDYLSLLQLEPLHIESPGKC